MHSANAINPGFMTGAILSVTIRGDRDQFHYIGGIHLGDMFYIPPPQQLQDRLFLASGGQDQTIDLRDVLISELQKIMGVQKHLLNPD